MKIIKLIALFVFISINVIHGQDAPKNGLAFEFGYGGGDGIFPTYIYGLQYNRALKSRLTAYAKYNISQGSEIFSTLEEANILEKNTAENPNSRYGQFVFVGVGLETKIVRTPKSYLFLLTGLRYTQSKRSRTNDSIADDGSKYASSDNFQNNLFGYELGIGYRRHFSEKYFVGGSINFANVESRISFSLIAGVSF